MPHPPKIRMTQAHDKDEWREFLEQLVAEMNAPDRLAEVRAEIAEGRAAVARWHAKRRQAIIDKLLKDAL